MNESAQVALYEEARQLDARIDQQTEAIQKLLEEVRQNGGGQDLSIVDVWGRKIPEEKKALAGILQGLQALNNGDGVDTLEQAVNDIDYQLLEIDQPKFDKSTYLPIS